MAPPGPAGTDVPGDATEEVAAACVGGVAGAEAFALPDSIAARISFLLMRPPAPLPSTPVRSTWCSFARRRTSGELRMSLPLPRPDGTALGAGAAAACACGVGGAGAGAGEVGVAALDVAAFCCGGAGA